MNTVLKNQTYYQRNIKRLERNIRELNNQLIDFESLGPLYDDDKKDYDKTYKLYIHSVKEKESLLKEMKERGLA
jgi:hypothetical protein